MGLNVLDFVLISILISIRMGFCVFLVFVFLEDLWGPDYFGLGTLGEKRRRERGRGWGRRATEQ
jgi:hypothetical protein